LSLYKTSAMIEGRDIGRVYFLCVSSN